MREICNDSSLSVPKGKRVQRQVRYERLKEEFFKLVSGLNIDIPNKNDRTENTQSSENHFESQMLAERADF